MVDGKFYIYKSSSAKTIGLRSRGERLVKDAAGNVTSQYTTPPIRIQFSPTANGEGVFILNEASAKAAGVSSMDELKKLIEEFPTYGADIVLLEPGSAKPEDVQRRPAVATKKGVKGRK